MNDILPPEVVLTSAIEVGIGIAGFTGIVIALSQNLKVTPELKVLVSILLLSSIASVGFAFLPLLLASAGLEDHLVWVLSSAVFLVYFVAIIAVRTRQTVRAPGVLAGPILIGFPVFSAAALLQIPNVFYFQQAWPYLVLIVAYLLYAFSVFVTVLTSLRRD